MVPPPVTCAHHTGTSCHMLSHVVPRRVLGDIQSKADLAGPLQSLCVQANSWICTTSARDGQIQQGMVNTCRVGNKIRISRAAPPVKSGTHHRGSQPGRESAKIPLRTNVRTRAQDDEETQLVCNAYESLNVLRPVPFELARIQLMMIPGNVHLHIMSQRGIKSEHDGLQVLG